MRMTFKNTTELLKYIGDFSEKFGTDVYIVGGYVRDALLDKDVKDLDFTVLDRGVEFAKKLAESMGVKNVVEFEKFGTIFIPLGDYALEFVQARSETYEPESRKPIVEKGDLRTDLARRDFTFNCLCQKLTADGPGEIVDLFGGKEDLKNGIVKTPLDPEETFDDDPLRMLRAIRFVSRFGFKLEEKTLEGIIGKKDRISIVSQERITDEFSKIMMTDKPSIGLELFRETGLLAILYPNLQKLIGVEQVGKYHHKDVWFHTLKVVDNLSEMTDDLKVRLAGLYHDIAKPNTKKFVEGIGWTFHAHEVLGSKMVSKILKDMKFPSETITFVKLMVRLHLRPIGLQNESVTDSAIRRLVADAGENLEDLMKLCRADITSGNPEKVVKHLKNFDYVEQRIEEVENIDAFRAFQSPVDGQEIMKVFKLKPSKQVGVIKKFIEEAILEGEIPHDHDAAYDFMLANKDKFLE